MINAGKLAMQKIREWNYGLQIKWGRLKKCLLEGQWANALSLQAGITKKDLNPKCFVKLNLEFEFWCSIMFDLGLYFKP